VVQVEAIGLGGGIRVVVDRDFGGNLHGKERRHWKFMVEQ